MSRTKKEVNLVKKEVVNLARKEKTVSTWQKEDVSLAKKRMSIGQKEDVAGK